MGTEEFRSVEHRVNCDRISEAQPKDRGRLAELKLAPELRLGLLAEIDVVQLCYHPRVSVQYHPSKLIVANRRVYFVVFVFRSRSIEVSNYTFVLELKR